MPSRTSVWKMPEADLEGVLKEALRRLARLPRELISTEKQAEDECVEVSLRTKLPARVHRAGSGQGELKRVHRGGPQARETP